MDRRLDDGWIQNTKKQTNKISIHRDKKRGQNASPKPPTCQTCSAPHGNHPLPPAAADVCVHTHTHTHTHAHTIPFPTCLDLQRYGFNGSRRAPKSTLLTCTQVILKGVCPSVSGSLDSGESQGGVGMGWAAPPSTPSAARGRSCEGSRNWGRAALWWSRWHCSCRASRRTAVRSRGAPSFHPWLYSDSDESTVTLQDFSPFVNGTRCFPNFGSLGNITIFPISYDTWTIIFFPLNICI